jgi:hypothetical protein
MEHKGSSSCSQQPATDPYIQLDEPSPHVRWVPWHHGMARPQVVDGGKASSYRG